MAKEGLGTTENFAATVIRAKKRTSLRLILIEEDQGQGENVKPLAQVELCKMEVEGDPVSLVAELAAASQAAIKTILEGDTKP